MEIPEESAPPKPPRKRSFRASVHLKMPILRWAIRKRSKKKFAKKKRDKSSSPNVSPVNSRSSSVSALTGRSYRSFKLDTPAKRWMSSFARSDPRWQINSFFLHVAQQGAVVEDLDASTDLLLRVFSKASVFTVWRPCSVDAIRKMISGQAVGKGLEIKGKSAKMGSLSGFVPYLQIHEEQHKRRVGTLHQKGRTRIFFKTKELRDDVLRRFKPVKKEMVSAVNEATRTLLKASGMSLMRSLSSRALGGKNGLKAQLLMAEKRRGMGLQKSARRLLPRQFSRRGDRRRKPSAQELEEERESALEKLLWEMADPAIRIVDDYSPVSYGLDLPDRLLWKVAVSDQEIERIGDLCTGRPSEPAFQDMNNKAIFNTRKNHGPNDAPRVVLWQTGEEWDPRLLVMAYEEGGRVLPVVSDFDCFTMGTRGVCYSSPLPGDQVDLFKWCVENVNGVLEKQQQSDGSMSWTSRWLEVLKASAIKGFQPTMPRFGFGDKKSYGIMEAAVGRCVEGNGAVRHGAECFNYYFPQELDEEFLVVSDLLPGKVPWRYVGVNELQEFLVNMIDKGFTFPLNPKWVLCDPGWKEIYDRLSASKAPNVQESLSVWYPPDSGIRESMETVVSRYPKGFVHSGHKQLDKRMSGTEAMDLATLELNRYLTLQRAKKKLRAVLLFNKLCRPSSVKKTTIQEIEVDEDPTNYQESIENPEDTEFWSSRENEDEILIASC